MARDGGTFDYIVCGAGSAGCVMAARLSESGKYKVLLLEAGPSDERFWVKTPMGYPMLYTNPAVNWMFESEPEPELNNRALYQARGKLLGGSSSINGMIYIRGNPRDYDTWRQMGCEGWGWEDVLPYFRKSENNMRGADAFHGAGGPLTVSDQAFHPPIAQAMVEAGVQAGLPRNPDFNGARQEGAGFFQTTTRNKRRASSSQAYLKPARGRANLKTVTGAHVGRVLLEGRKAVGVEYYIGAETFHARADGEIVISGGAFGSPQTLLVSGIGGGEHLQAMGVPVLHDLKPVGDNLQDHFYTSVMFRCSQPVTMNDIANSWLKQLWIGAQYVLLNKGPLTTNGIYAGFFARSNPSLDLPDLQINTNIWTVASRDKSGMKPHPFPGVTLSPVHIRPDCRGTIRLKSADPKAPPEIRFNYLKTRHDIDAMIAGVRLVRKIAAQAALKPYVVGEISPGPEKQSDAEIEAAVRATGISNLHPVGSCRMGHDESCVVDTRLRVHGMEGLRVVDTSIMPRIPAGNTNAPVIMVAEKASDMMLEDARR